MSKIQSVLFDRKKWTMADARKWLKMNRMKPIKSVDKTTNFYRYRLYSPKKFKRFAMKPIKKHGLLFVIGFRK